MTAEKFKEIKEIILERAKDNKACKEQYKIAYKSEDFEELCVVIKDNYIWCCKNQVIDGEFLTEYKEEFAEQDIYVNESVNKGYLYANGNSTVNANGNSTVYAYDNATVYANDNSTVNAYDNSYIQSFFIKECKLHNNAIYRVVDTNTIFYANDEMNFENQEK